MTVDIDQLTYDELVALNHRVVERLEFLKTVRAHRAMMALSIGSRVSFESRREGRLTGTVIKRNQKTVTVRTDDEDQWRVPPEMLSPIKDVETVTTIVSGDNHRSE